MLEVDCFITTNDERTYFKELTKTALISSGFNVKYIRKPMLTRYFKAEHEAQTDLYIFIDDDIIPSTVDTLKELVSIMKEHPEYSQLGLGWKPDMRSEEGSSWIRNKGDPIWEMDHCGGCMIIRKGTIKDLGIKPEFPSGYGDDRVMGETARRLGYKVGIVPHLWFHHLGVQSSTIEV